jgi:hypothetical protein
MGSVIFCPLSSISGDHHCKPILIKERVIESSDDESSDNELTSVKELLEDVLNSQPDVIDLTFDSKFEVSQL